MVPYVMNGRRDIISCGILVGRIVERLKNTNPTSISQRIVSSL